jgi:hypothetical protein
VGRGSCPIAWLGLFRLDFHGTMCVNRPRLIF